MIPVRSIQGLSPTEIKSLINDRDVYIWGTSDLGQDVRFSLLRSGITPVAFLSTNPLSLTIDGLPVMPVDTVIGASFVKERSFFVIATKSFIRKAEAICQKFNLIKNIDFINYFLISRQEAVIDITDTIENHKASMSIDSFKEVINKLLCDQPMLINTTIGLWGDPLRHPNVAEIIRICSKLVPCRLLTPMCNDADLESIICAGLRRLDIVMYGYAYSYEEKNGKGTWQTLLYNIEQLKSLTARIRTDMCITLKYIRTKDDPKDSIEHIKQIIKGSAFVLSVELPYIEPYDHLLEYCRTKAISDKTKLLFANLTWDIDKALSYTMRNKNFSCLCQRIFPVIKSDLSVGVCHLYQNPELLSSYIDSDWNWLVKKRSVFPHCEACQYYGLHRLDISVLSELFLSFHSEIFEEYL